MVLTPDQKDRIRAAIIPLIPRLKAAAPPERARLLREVLERCDAQPCWDEWDACVEELLGEDAAHVRSAAVRT